MAEMTQEAATTEWYSRSSGKRWRWPAAAFLWGRGEAFLGLLLAGLFVGLALILPSTNVDIFNSPDESSNYIFTKAMAEQGHPWYSEDYLYLDQENLLHPRGMLTHEDRIVPFNYLGVPIIYGLLYTLVGDSLRYIGVVCAAISIWAMYRAASNLFGAKAWEVAVVALAVVPFVYYFNRPYMNATPAMTMMFVGAWLFTRYLRDSRVSDLVLASIAVSMAAFFRYEYILFIAGFAVWGLYVKHRSLRSRAFIRDLLIWGGVVGAVFVVPVLALNQWIYGNWSTYGYSLFNDVYFPERNDAEGASMVISLATKARSILLPAYPFDFIETARNVPRLTLWFMPLLTVLGISGFFALVRGGAGWRFVLPVLALAVYILLYRGSGQTWNAEGTGAALNTAVIRYWLLFYAMLGFAAIYGLRRLTDSVAKAAIVLGLILTGPIYVYTLSDQSLHLERQLMTDARDWGETILIPKTEEDAIVYASRTDKRILPHRDTATWWNGEEFYDSTVVATSMARVAGTGKPVYLLRESEVDMDELSGELAARGYRAVSVGGGLYRIEPVAAGSRSN